MPRKSPKRQPTLEALEGRRLLSGSDRTLRLPNGLPINDQDHTRLVVQLRSAGLDPQNLKPGDANKVWSSLPQRRIPFVTPDGVRGALTLYGVGTLRGTTYTDGVFDIVYDNTNSQSRLIARLHHRPDRPARVNLRSLRDADVVPSSISGVGSNQIGNVNLPNFDVIENGYVNLSGGVQIVQLGRVGPNTEMNLRSLPQPTTAVLPVGGVQIPTVTFVATAGGGAELAGIGGLTVPGAVGSISANVPQGFTTRVNAAGQVELVPIGSGATSTNFNGVSLLVDGIDGRPSGTPFGKDEILGRFFGFDPATRELVTFDAGTGKPIGAPITVASGTLPANGEVGVGLGRDQGVQVVLVGIGTTVSAYDAATGAFEGTFSTSSLDTVAPTITGIGRTDAFTVLTSSTSQKAWVINVTQSLAAGMAVLAKNPAGQTIPAFTPQNEFTLSGGATGVAGVSNAYLTGNAHFNTFTPSTTQFGVLTTALQPTASPVALQELARTQVSSPSSFTSGQITATPPPPDPIALGSRGLFPALVTGFTPASGSNPAVNNVTLYDIRDYSPSGSVNLVWPRRLTGLSENVYPQLDGEALINVAGILTRIVSPSATGMILNGIGYLNSIDIDRVLDSTIIGLPVGHVTIDSRENVTILSSDNRPTGTQNGVTLVPGLKPVGPFVLPRVVRPFIP